ncbi:SHOCT domain-containing protein [Hymenobacter elongatus]|uniref:SHOCT domain-containing protein n=1 Tax=Hymenobacter elongatus TaxID=877208 RepID=A0A4Z0PSJ8_9BACT|nr:SHOCT domain-containing protein [Hymenobacter elongatus]TGE19833.1 SHOCT domain-containing protein [Hymenobacter elongatus]
MEKDPSPLDTLRQLKEWLDAGTITPAEFETLKRKLLFSEQTPPVVAAPSAPAIPEATASAPVEDPMLPPILPRPTPPAPAWVPPAAPSDTFSHPRESGRPDASPSAAAGAYEAAETVPQEEEDAVYVAPARSPLSTILIVGGILALLALIAYLTLGNRESEHLSSATRTEQDSLSTTPEVGPQAETIELPPATAPETVRVAPALPPAAAPVSDSASATPAPAPASEPVVTPAETPADDSAIRTRIENTLQAYYEDLKTAPFSATQHFSPIVERFYTLQNTTPAAISEELGRSHFPEFLEASTQIEPGSLQIGDVANDGSRMVNFLEKSQAFRQSQQKHQQTRAQVRVRFDRNYKIKYLRQERLLENTFTD